MTKKTRRSSSSDDASRARSSSSAGKKPAESTDRKAAGRSGRKPEAKATKKPEPGSEAATPATEGAEKITLPAFGFATDLLKPGEAGEPAPDEEPATAPPADDLSEVDQADPRRIFAFADTLERNTTEDEQSATTVKLETWVTFELADETFALPVNPVREVVRVASITRVPHAPRPIRGVTNMRGRVIPVIDLRLRIELPETELARSSRVIVVSSRGRLLGLLVDSVHQVVHIDANQVQPPPDDVMTVQSDYLCGVYHQGDHLILLLDIDRALIIHEAAQVSAGRSATAASASTAEDRPQA